MKYVDEGKINHLLDKAGQADTGEFERILAKSLNLQRLSLEESAVLLATEEPAHKEKILKAASIVKERIYGKRVVLFAPLYISNFCRNRCLYCAFKSDNKAIRRKALSTEEIKEQVEWLLSRGHKRILVVTGEAAPGGKSNIEYLVEAVKAVYSARIGAHRIKRVNVNCAPLSLEDFRRLKSAGIGTYQIFQETYHEQTYRQMHPAGPKSDPDNRIDAVDRAFKAGIDDIGIGLLYGLYDFKFDTLGMLSHVGHLEERFGVGPHTISVPRIEPALGVEFCDRAPNAVSDDDFKKIVAVLRLSVPYTGIILSTRETPALRDELFSLGVSQISAESRTSPGGYCRDDENGQFVTGDRRSLDEVIASLIKKGFIPSFCAACYRKERTGEAFMDLARPGTIKGKCSMNALITFKEYLDDFASLGVKEQGYKLIDSLAAGLPEQDKKQLGSFFAGIERGVRDEYV